MLRLIYVVGFLGAVLCSEDTIGLDLLRLAKAKSFFNKKFENNESMIFEALTKFSPKDASDPSSLKYDYTVNALGFMLPNQIQPVVNVECNFTTIEKPPIMVISQGPFCKVLEEEKKFVPFNSKYSHTFGRSLLPEHPIPSDSPELLKLANFASRKLEEMQKGHYFSVSKVSNASKKFASDVFYEFDMDLIPESCPMDQPTCPLSHLQPLTCRVKILRSWATDSSSNLQLVESTCNPQSRESRELTSFESCLQGELDTKKMIEVAYRITQRMSDILVFQRKQVTLIDFFKISEKKKFSNDVKDHCKVQIEVLLRFDSLFADSTFPNPKVGDYHLCTLTASLSKKTLRIIDKDCRNVNNLSQILEKRSLPQYVALPSSYDEAIKSALKKLSKPHLSFEYLNVLNYHRQILPASFFIFNVSVAHKHNLPGQFDEGLSQCILILYFKNDRESELISGTCTPVLDSQQKISENPEAVDVNEEGVKQLAEVALEDLQSSDRINQKITLIKVLDANVKVLSGLLYSLKLEVAFSNCSKSEADCSDTLSDKKICNMTVWTHEWLNSIRISNVSCENMTHQNVRRKRSLQPLESKFSVVYDVKDSEIQKYVQIALPCLQNVSGFQSKPVLLEVISVKQQEHQIPVYYLKLKVGPKQCTNCAKDETSKICEIALSVYWRMNHTDVIYASCDDKPSSRKMRSPQDHKVGAFEEIDVKNSEVQNCAQTALASIENVSGFHSKPVLLEVISAERQVVSGYLYKLKLKVGPTQCTNCAKDETSKICNVKVVVQSWLNKTEVIEASCEDKPSSRKKRSSQDHKVGASEEIDVKDSEVQNCAQTALASIENVSGFQSKPVLLEVISAERQVVSGYLYKLKLKVGPTQCANCAKDEDSKICNVKVWVQSWLNKTEVTDASCEEKPSSRKEQPSQDHIPGGFKKINVKDSDVQRYAQTALASLENLSGFQSKPVLLEVISAERQVVSGLLYKLKLKVGPTQCANCAKDEDSKICNVKVWVQSWLNKTEVSEASCEDKPSSRKKRSSQDHIVGGFKEINVKDSEVQNCAQTALASIENVSGFQSKPVLLEVISAESQVVSGVLYKLKLKVGPTQCTNCAKDEDSKICNVKVWVQSWLNKTEVSDASCEDKPSSRRKRSSQDHKVGASEEIDVKDSEVQRYAQTALASIENVSGFQSKPVLLEVISAERQVVSGYLYKLKLKVGPTQCANCAKDEDSKICNVKVWVQSWLNKTEVTDASCEDKPSSRKKQSSQDHIPGGFEKIDVKDSDVQRYAQTALASLENLSGFQSKPVLLEVISAESQVVSGVLYKLKLKVGPTQCANCAKDEDSKICNVKVWVQSWLNKTEVSDASCEDKPSSRRKRSSQDHKVGAFKEIDVKDSEVQNCAQTALASIENVSGFQSKPVLLEVISAERQVVSGYLYKLKLKVGPTQCANCAKDEDSKICNVKVWVQSWLNKTEVTDASCEDKPSSRKKQPSQDHIPGGFKKIDVKDSDVQRYAQTALASLENLSGFQSKPVLLEVISAESQVVSGVLYKLKLKVGPTQCTNCAKDEDSKICNVKVWVQSWLNKTEVSDASCEDKPSSRRKRSSQDHKVGASEEIDVKDSEVQRYAQTALASIENVSGFQSKPVLLEVISAERQVVSGYLYKLKLKVGPTQCANCAKDEDSKICNVKVWVQSWLNKTEVTDASCEDKPSSRKKQPSQDHIPGGFSKIDVKDSDVQSYAQTALASLENLSGFQSKPVLLEVISAESQVVSGVLYKLKLKVGPTQCANCAKDEDSKICNVKVWVQSWLNKTEVTDASCEDKPSSRKKRSSQDHKVGAFKEIDVKDSEVQNCAQTALASIENVSGFQSKPILLEVISAERQVVSGYLYKLKLKVGPTQCANCAKDEDSKICNVKVWVQSWLNKTEVTDASCEDKPSSRKKQPSQDHIPGGFKKIDVKDSDVQRYAQTALASLENLSGFQSKPVLLEVISAESQVVSGVLYKLKLKVGPTQCTNCAKDEDSKICNVKVVVQSWLNKTEVSDASCEDKPSSRKKRSSQDHKVGASEEIDVKDSEVQNCAQTALASIENVSGFQSKPVLLEVISAERQVVSGYLYKLKLKVGPTQCANCTKDETSKICNVKVWVQSWLNKREVTDASCEDKPSSRKKRSSQDRILGGFEIVDIKDSDVQRHAQTALASLENVSGFQSKLVLLDVISVERQVVSGVLYKLKLKVGPTQCTNCAKDETSKICNVKVVVQSWLNKTEVLEPSCEDKPSSRKKRSLSTHSDVPEEMDARNPQYQTYALAVFKAIERAYGSQEELELLEVVKVLRQIHARNVYSLKVKVRPIQWSKSKCTHEQCYKICNVDVLVPSWNQIEQIGNASCENAPSSRPKRSPLPGTVRKISPDDDKVIKYSKMALPAIEELMELDHKLEIVRILDARVRYVSGLIYQIKMEIGYSNCSKVEADEGDCVYQVGDPKMCNVKIWVQEWLNTVKVTDAACEGTPLIDNRKRRSSEEIRDSFIEVDVKDKMIQKYAQDALATLNSLTNSKYKFRLMKIIDAKVQVLSSLLYSLRLELGYSKCLKATPESSTKFDNCSSNLAEPKICKVKVLVHESLNSTQFSGLACEDKQETSIMNAENRKKRISEFIFGRSKPLDVNDAKILKLAKKSLGTLEELFGCPNKLKILKLMKAKRQIIMGYLYSIKMIINYAECFNRSKLAKNLSSNHLVICSAHIWVREWLNSEQVINASCDFKRGKTKRAIKHEDDRNVDEIGREFLDYLQKPQEETFTLSPEYVFQLEVGTSYCPGNEAEESEDYFPRASPKNCITGRRKGLKFKESTECIDCEVQEPAKKRKKRIVIAGRQPLDIHSEDVLRKCREVLEYLLKHFKNGTVLSLNKIINAKVELVNGALFTFVLEVSADTQCPGVEGALCDEKEKVHKFCLVRLLEKDWLNHSEVIYSKCAARYDALWH